MLIVKTIGEVLNEIPQFYQPIPLKTEIVDLEQALGRVLAEDGKAMEDIPHFCRSTVDGWAVKAADTFGASEAFPAILKISGEVEMGKKPGIIVSKEQACYVPTGGWVPEGADAVVMIEFCEILKDELLVYKPVSPGASMVFCGDDAKKNEVIVPKGTLLGAKEIGTLSALGISTVNVYCKPTIGIISTGNEIVDCKTPFDPEKAQMRDVNRYLVSSLISQWGGNTKFIAIVKDDEEMIREAVNKALSECDGVIMSGGSSAGIKDNSMKVIGSLPDSEFLTHGLSIKPGKPTILGRSGTKAVIGLPGHPVSAYFILQTVIKSIFAALLGVKTPERTYHLAKAAEKIPSNNGRDDFVAGKVENGIFRPIPMKSGLITLLSSSDGYIQIGRDCEGVNKDETVRVYQY